MDHQPSSSSLSDASDASSSSPTSASLNQHHPHPPPPPPPPPLQLDSFLLAHSNHPQQALNSLISQFNLLSNQLSSTRSQLNQHQEQQQANENELKLKIKQLQDENRQLWTLISKSKTELKSIKAENKELLLKSHPHLLPRLSTTETTSPPRQSSSPTSSTINNNHHITPQPACNNNNNNPPPSSPTSIDKFLPNYYQPQRDQQLLRSSDLATPTTEELDYKKPAYPSTEPASISHSNSVPHLFDSATTTSLALASSTSSSLQSDQLPSNPGLKPYQSNNHQHNNNNNQQTNNNNNKFRLSLHPTAKQQPSSKHFHRHSVLPPEARQYVSHFNTLKYRPDL
jgi:hypothetical protein